MIVPVVGEDIEAHAAIHIFQILRIITGQNLRQLHQTVVIKAWLLKIQFQKSSSCQHMDTFFTGESHDAIKTFRPEIAFTYIRRK